MTASTTTNPMSTSNPVERVHRALFPTASPTALHELPSLAAELGVKAVYVKDESARYGLPAFKILGASYALATVLGRRWGVEPWDVPKLREKAKGDQVTVFAATDGAWAFGERANAQETTAARQHTPRACSASQRTSTSRALSSRGPSARSKAKDAPLRK